jgi:large subunit ribosomal protein L30
MVNKTKKQLKVKLVRSTIGVIPNHKANVKALGLRRMHQEVILQDCTTVRGMINKVSHLLKVEEM